MSAFLNGWLSDGADGEIAEHFRRKGFDGRARPLKLDHKVVAEIDALFSSGEQR